MFSRSSTRHATDASSFQASGHRLRRVAAFLIVLCATAPFLGGCGVPAEADEGRAVHAMTRAATFDEHGDLLRPRGYRRWIFVGAPITPNDMNNGKAAFPEFHNVYVDPAGYDHYKATGTWDDGTVVLKELASVGTKQATSGNGYFMGDLTGLEAAVKDSRRFADQPGHWGYFRFTDEDGGAVHSKARALPATACAACHEAAADDDLVFTQYYPMLRAAKGFGAGAPEDE